MWGLLVFYLAGLTRYEFVVKHYYPHTIGLLIGMSFAVAFEFTGRRRLNAYWAGRNDLRNSTKAVSP